MLLKIKNFTKEFGHNSLFENALASIDSGERVALIGSNGAGKTTLLRCIAGEEDFDGDVELVANTRVALMEQERVFEAVESSFIDYLEMKKQRIEQAKQLLETKLGEPSVYENQKLYDRILHEYALLCSRTVEGRESNRLLSLLQELQFDPTLLTQPICKLSGGQKTVLRLVEVLSVDADLLILDEPTNHLDFRKISWLERYLRAGAQTVLVVSHDREFINRFVNKVLEIENKSLQTYRGNYVQYVQLRAEHRETMRARYESVTAKKERMLESAEEKRLWASLAGNRGQRITADRLERAANALPDVADPETLEENYTLRVVDGPRLPNRVCEVQTVSMALGERVLLSQASLTIQRGERVALLGANGVGKTTLLKLFMGLLKPDAGSIFVAENARIGYFDQEGENLPKDKKVMEYLRKEFVTFSDHHIERLAEQFGLEFDLPKKKIKDLSGGEKARVQLLALLAGGYNVLLLDEPTNHLDLSLRESLEVALQKFTGTVLFVSHDRYFIKRVATSVVTLKDKKLHVYGDTVASLF